MLRRKPLLCRTSRILQLFHVKSISRDTHRTYSWLRPVTSHQDKDEIKDWVKGSLHEPLPAQHFPERLDPTGSAHAVTKGSSRSITIISEEEYCLLWRNSFRTADLTAVEQVLERAKCGVLFNIAQIAVLIRALSIVRRNYEIHEIYCAYKEYLPLIDAQATHSSAHQEFLETILRVEQSLGNYHLCETLFSDYIKCPNLDPQIILIGLRTFLRNDNLQLAKQFFIQVLDNPETFPITKVELKSFLTDLSGFNDLETAQFVFKLWLSKKCDGCTISLDYYPDGDTISILHRLYLQANDPDGLKEFLSLEAVKKSGYPSDVMFEVNELCHQLRLDKEMLDESQVAEKVDYFLTLLQHRKSDRRQFYSSLLDSLVKGKNFSSIRHVVSKVRGDTQIRLDGSFHLIIARFFVKQGLLNHLLQYYSDVVRNQTAGRIRLKVENIEQLWLCALQTYPFLTREITNELKVILDNKIYLRRFTDLRKIIRQTSQVRRRRLMGGDEYIKSALSLTDFRRLQKFEYAVSKNDVAGAITAIMESLKQGTKPQFDFYFCAIRISLTASLPSLAKSLNDILLKSYRAPLKLNILWLRYDALLQYQQTVSKSEMLSFGKVPLIEAQLKEFHRSHQESLNFQNYLQLSQISIFIRDYHQASLLLNRALGLIDKQDRQQWLMYYMTALKLSTRLYKSQDFLRTLKDWNQNTNASLISHGCIRQIKAFTKLFVKRRNQNFDYDYEVAQEISKEIELAVEKYVGLKFEGLNESRKLCKLLTRWLNQEMKELARDERKRRKALDLAVAEYSDEA
ncbi:Pet111p TDEL_0B00880 [Torulaspora delbrueckii]|uniref:Mitochondrial group I intron splicing factor CCM1 n=1 Tax=Torulaspora delbrueckii TaxID=4950 RepID=G8ZNM3_TORDE|nr:hypothetical protein TDEL_0B00880 [Torulaspora delbrueckii]CCE90217.1 hypothetical protein TDEL_0B00880 [Torulaspora delbrueckii]